MDAPAERRSPRTAGSGNRKRLGGQFDYASLAGSRKAGQSSDFKSAFIGAMVDAGIVPTEPDQIAADGTLHRFHVEGDKRGTRAGWAVLHVDQHGAGGVFGHWRTWISSTWRSGRGKISSSERKRLSASIEQARRARDADRLLLATAAQASASRLWSQAAPPHDHPYALRKRITACGSRQLNDLLLVPLRDVDGVLWNVQTITPDGTKRFLHGGRKRGLYHAIGEIGDSLLICEGFATAASLYEATGKAVAVAFDCGNLESVARSLRAKYPQIVIVICADNDAGTPGNPGLTKATAAARAVGGKIAIPPEPFCDFNDAAVAGVNP